MSMFHLKDLNILNLEPMLEEIVLAVNEEFGLDVITDAFRPDDAGVHGQMLLRGLDLRCKSKYMGPVIVEWVNARWEYDPNRPHLKCAVFHNTGRGLHLHFQVHPRTVKIIRRRL